MSLIDFQLDRTINKVDMAIERVKLAALSPEPLCVCYSGGKDSKVLRRICEMAEVPFELHYNHTSVDHPSVVREIMDDPAVMDEKPRDEFGKQITMWSLIVQNKMPPTRLVRYCCSELKENGGQGRICVTGVRKAESVARAQNGGEIKIINGNAAKKIALKKDIAADYQNTPKGGIVMNLDNDENRRMVEICYRTNKTLINPLVDWTDGDVWEFSRAENIKQSDLYVENGGTYKRLGCILCPNASACEKEMQMHDYPKIAEAYIHTFDKMLRVNSEIDYTWKSGEEVYDWWIYGTKKSKMHIDQISMYELIKDDSRL